MPTIPYGLIGNAVDAAIAAVKGSSKKDEKKPEEKKPAEEKPKQEPKKEYKKGGKVMNEGNMMKKAGRNMAKADMQKIASGAVKKHEKAMHGMKTGGYVRSADGCATRGKTKGRMI